MRKIVLTFGLIAGAILSVMMLLTVPFADQIGYDKSMVIGYTTMVLAFLMIYFGVRSYRDNVLGGTIAFRQALLPGLLIMLVASFCYVATWEAISARIGPEWMDKYAAHEIDQARASGATDAELAAKTQELAHFRELYRNPLLNIAFTLMEPLPVGLVFVLLTAGLLSRRPKSQPATSAEAGASVDFGEGRTTR